MIVQCVNHYTTRLDDDQLGDSLFGGYLPLGLRALHSLHSDQNTLDLKKCAASHFLQRNANVRVHCDSASLKQPH